MDDHAVVRFGIAQLVNQQSDLVVCGEEEDAANALRAINQLKPDLVIADMLPQRQQRPGADAQYQAQHAGLPVLVVSAHDESLYAEVAFRAGALGYLMKADALEKIPGRHSRVLDGNVYVSDALAARLLQQQVRGARCIQRSPVKGLSDRELEVFQLIGQWKKTREIAQALHLSIKTIEYYREQIKQKLDLKGTAELTQYATAWVQRENLPDPRAETPPGLSNAPLLPGPTPVPLAKRRLYVGWARGLLLHMGGAQEVVAPDYTQP